MRVFQFVVLVMCAAYVCPGPLHQREEQPLTPPLSPGRQGRTVALHSQAYSTSDAPLSRSRRWILSWLLGYASLQDHANSKRQTDDKHVKKEEKPVRRDDGQRNPSAGHGTYHSSDEEDNTSVEAHNLPGTVMIDLSGDTRVNYQDGRSQIGALARESDAEVFDWNLLREDMERNSGDQNPYYFQSSSVSSRLQRPVGVPSSYGAQARPVRGFLRRNGGQTGLNTFNRFPISYKQSQEFANSRRRHFGATY